MGDETPRNNKKLPLGGNIPGTEEEFHPLASVASSRPLQLPLGDETPRNKAELPFRDKTPVIKEDHAHNEQMNDKNENINENENETKTKTKTKTTKTTTKKTPNLQG